MDPHHLKVKSGTVSIDTVPDLTYPDADPNTDFYLMVIRIGLFTLMRIRIQILASN
jgi:hypothetical protein